MMKRLIKNEYPNIYYFFAIVYQHIDSVFIKYIADEIDGSLMDLFI
jgi:hypothetical protein